MKKLSLIVVLFCAAAPLRALALDLSLARAREMILQESQDLKKADANLRKARAGLDAVNANRWFHIDGTASYMNIVNVEKPGRAMGVALPANLAGLAANAGLPLGALPGFIEFPDNVFMAGATVTAPIYTFGKIGNAADAARVAIRMAESGHRMAGAEIRAAAAQIYWTAKMSDELVAIAEKNLAASVDAKRQIARAGRAGKANLVKISADIASKEIALSDAKFNRDSAYRLLKVMAGIDAEEPLSLVSEFPEKFDPIAGGGLDANPEWDMLESRAQMYESQASSRRAAHYPTLGATAAYNYISTHDDYRLWRGQKTQAAYWGLNLSVPIFDGGLSRANATIDAMDAQAARLDLDKSRKLKSNEYDDAVMRHRHLAENLEHLRDAQALAQKAADISRDRFSAGQTSAAELADVQAACAQMDAAVLGAKFNLLMAEETAMKLKGE